MSYELDVLSPAWTNFCDDIEWTTMEGSLTIPMIMPYLKEYRGWITEIGEWRVYFETEADRTYFLLKWL